MAAKQQLKKRHDMMVDDQKWSAAINYVRAYNDWKIALRKYGAFDKKVQELWELLLVSERQYKRMAKK